MGCLVGVFATVVAAGFGWLAHFFGAPVGLIAIVVAATLGLFALPVIKYGHVEFRGGGRIDFMLYVLVVGIVAAVAVPRFVSPVACSRSPSSGRAWWSSRSLRPRQQRRLRRRLPRSRHRGPR